MEDAFLYTNKISATVRSRDLLQLLSDAYLFGLQKSIRVMEEFSTEAAYNMAFKRFCTPRTTGKIRAPFDQFSDKPLTKIGEHHLRLYHFGEENRPTVLLVHGWTGRGSDFSFFVEPLLKAGFRVIVFDSPAHGESMGTQTNAIEVAQIIQDIVELVGPIEAIVGHSFGGFASSIAMANSPALKGKKLITIGTPNKLKKVIDDFSSLLKLSGNVSNRLRKEIEDRFQRKIETINTANFIEESDANALIIHDTKDRLVNYEEKDHMVQSLSRVSHLETEGLGHTRILFNEDVIDRVIEFLNSDA
jgi:esterase/lipase